MNYDTEQFWLEHYGEPSGVRGEVVPDWQRFGFDSECEYDRHMDEESNRDEDRKDNQWWY